VVAVLYPHARSDSTATPARVPYHAEGRDVSDPSAELTAFMRRYEQATNRHDVDQLAPLIADDATYWFTDGSYHGIDAIKAALERTFTTILDEIYTIDELEWVAIAEDFGVCRYHFHWTGVIDGVPASGHGRGTNLVVRQNGSWKMLHEHLSR
jgi:ketosteroid isomerase-like protein